uniref:Uncharacterized protein n=1 Tax=Fagus sylvatica TaxID=28930 RepID=A0A2N9FZ52_FAGSY
MVYGKFFRKPFSKTRVRLPLDSASHPAPPSSSLSLSLSYIAKQAIRLSTGPSASSWLRAAVGLKLGLELVVEGGAVGLEVELVVDRSLDLRSKLGSEGPKCSFHIGSDGFLMTRWKLDGGTQAWICDRSRPRSGFDVNRCARARATISLSDVLVRQEPVLLMIVMICGF